MDEHPPPRRDGARAPRGARALAIMSISLAVTGALLATPYFAFINDLCSPADVCNGTYPQDVSGWQRSQWSVALVLILAALTAAGLSYVVSRRAKASTTIPWIVLTVPWVSLCIWMWPPFLPFWVTMWETM